MKLSIFYLPYSEEPEVKVTSERKFSHSSSLYLCCLTPYSKNNDRSFSVYLKIAVICTIGIYSFTKLKYAARRYSISIRKSCVLLLFVLLLIYYTLHMKPYLFYKFSKQKILSKLKSHFSYCITITFL